LETTSAIWSQYAGRSVETWRLESFLGLRDDRAFYVGQAYDVDEPLLIQLIAADGDSPVRAAWEHARSLSHEHLMRVRATGETNLDGTRVAYAVLDLPDDDLGEIMSRRTPDASESVALHTAIAGALDYLHRRGFRHGAIVPSNIFLVRDQVKLAVDSISPASEADQQTDLQQLESLGLPPPTGRERNAAPVWTADRSGCRCGHRSTHRLLTDPPAGPAAGAATDGDSETAAGCATAAAAGNS
jgi:hypothetical protein